MNQQVDIIYGKPERKLRSKFHAKLTSVLFIPDYYQNYRVRVGNFFLLYNIYLFSRDF